MFKDTAIPTHEVERPEGEFLFIRTRLGEGFQLAPSAARRVTDNPPGPLIGPGVPRQVVAL